MATVFDTILGRLRSAKAAASAIATLIVNLTAKTTPANADSMVIVDSAASNALKKVTWANIKATLKTYFDTLYAGASACLLKANNLSDVQSATTSRTNLGLAGMATVADAPSDDKTYGRKNGAWDAVDQAEVAAAIHGATGKDTPVDADEVGVVDSAASYVLKKTTWAQVKSTLKTYFDTLYNKYVHPNHSGEVTSVADGAQTIVNNAVTFAKMADLSGPGLVGRTLGTGDPGLVTLGECGLEITNAGTTKTTIPDNSLFGFNHDNFPAEPAFTWAYTTWTNIKSKLKTYFDTLYEVAGALAGHLSAFTHADIALNTTHRGLVTGNPHAVTKTEVGLGNVANAAQVTSVTGTSPLTSSGGTTPAISFTIPSQGTLYGRTPTDPEPGAVSAILMPVAGQQIVEQSTLATSITTESRMSFLQTLNPDPDGLRRITFANVRAAVGWALINISKYTAEPASTSTITMSDTSDMKVGLPAKYTYGGTTYYGMVTVVTTNTSITIAGAPLVTGGGSNLTALYVGDASKVQALSLFVSGTYADAADTDLLANDMRSPFVWTGPKAYLVAFRGTQGTADTGATETSVGVQINNAQVSTENTNVGPKMSATALTWVKNSAVAINTSNYDINYDEELELTTDATGTNKDAANLTVECVFVLE